MTAAQLQHLLFYLGYDPGMADGLLGPRTEAAIKAFQQDFGGLRVDGIPGPETEKALRQAVAEGWERAKAGASGFWGEIRYFTRAEFRCKCPRCGGFPAEPEEKLVRLADQVRSHFGSPVTITSGVRCQAHNDELKGSVPNSRHIRGKAMDFSVAGFSASAVLPYVQSLPAVRYAYAIDGGHIHMDVE